MIPSIADRYNASTYTRNKGPYLKTGPCVWQQISVMDIASISILTLLLKYIMFHGVSGKAAHVLSTDEYYLTHKAPLSCLM